MSGLTDAEQSELWRIIARVRDAETLRKAASLMRERAEVVDTEPDTLAGEPWTWQDGMLHVLSEPDNMHVASWHPAVALAVADWLETTAKWVERDERRSKMTPTETDDAALAVARAYLGEER